MMLIRMDVLVVVCDEKPCPRALPLGQYGVDIAVDRARNSGWRAYASARRRDLCPDHRNEARRRMHLVRSTP